MASKLKIKVNGLVHSVTASLDTPLLYVLHNELRLVSVAVWRSVVPARCCLMGRRSAPV
jgi:aerobic-type carbon monoxide dehydrogenase small subunit (CoxS/CutS family)